MKTPELEALLKGLDNGFSIEKHPKLSGLCSVKWNGKDCEFYVPDGEILEERNPSYTFTFPNGMSVPHPSRGETLAKAAAFLQMVKDDPEIALG